MLPFSPENQLVASAEAPGVGLVFPVDENSVAFISQLNPTPEHPNSTPDNNMLRRLCRLGGTACQETCQFSAKRPSVEFTEGCADDNLLNTVTALGVNLDKLLMVGVRGGNDVGFTDTVQPNSTANGWHEVGGFNAFFARVKEFAALGERLADCGSLEIRFEDREGNTVNGIVHLTKANLAGEDAYKFSGADGSGQVSYTQHVIEQAKQHYGAKPESFRMRRTSSIREANYGYNFSSRKKMEENFPGLFDAGFIHHVDGQPMWLETTDPTTPPSWHIDFRGIVQHDMEEAMAALGMSPGQFTCEGEIDPADTQGAHSSHTVSLKTNIPDSRDIYMLADRAAFTDAAA